MALAAARGPGWPPLRERHGDVGHRRRRQGNVVQLHGSALAQRPLRCTNSGHDAAGATGRNQQRDSVPGARRGLLI